MAKASTTRDTPLTAADKARIAGRCEAFIADVLVPRFLPEIRPTQFNYPIAYYGRWRGHRYSFLKRYRSGDPETLGIEFELPFARLDHIGGERFDVLWPRHTGRWYPLYPRLTLRDAMRAILADELLWP